MFSNNPFLLQRQQLFHPPTGLPQPPNNMQQNLANNSVGRPSGSSVTPSTNTMQGSNTNSSLGSNIPVETTSIVNKQLPKGFNNTPTGSNSTKSTSGSLKSGSFYNVSVHRTVNWLLGLKKSAKLSSAELKLSFYKKSNTGCYPPITPNITTPSSLTMPMSMTGSNVMPSLSSMMGKM